LSGTCLTSAARNLIACFNCLGSFLAAEVHLLDGVPTLLEADPCGLKETVAKSIPRHCQA
jgi:hypothetical protein